MEQIRRVAEIHNLPPHLLKTIEWNLRKDINEVEKVRVKKSKRVPDSQLLFYRHCAHNLTNICGCLTTDSWRMLALVLATLVKEPQQAREVNSKELET